MAVYQADYECRNGNVLSTEYECGSAFALIDWMRREFAEELGGEQFDIGRLSIGYAEYPEFAEYMEFVDGYEISVKMNPYLFFRCGYVAIPTSHPLCGSRYDCNGLYAHGGMTYGGEGECCYVFGFDCGHIGDCSDIDAARAAVESGRISQHDFEQLERLGYFDYFGDALASLGGPHCWTTEEVAEECKSIVRQLKEREHEER